MFRPSVAAVAALLALATTSLAQLPPPSPTSGTRRIDDRIRVLQREAERLAGASKTLVAELRTLEIERDLRAAEAERADQEVAAAASALEETTARIDALERQRVEQLPGLRAQLVEMYKRGATGYLPLLASARDLRDFGRTSRVLTMMGERDRRRIESHRATLDALRTERAALESRTRELQAREAAARQARAAAQRAVAAHARRLADIDRRRDLTAQYVGELQLARDALLREIETGRDGVPGVVTVPLAPFRGAIDWPVSGTVTGEFGDAAGRLGGSAVRNGIEIAAPAGTPVRAVHGGRVAHADPFTGFGTLVIIDHGGNAYTLYGYLGGTAVAAGQTVEPGDQVGEVGASPAGPPALYFEMRIDGRAVDPVQWLEPR